MNSSSLLSSASGLGFLPKLARVLIHVTSNREREGVAYSRKEVNKIVERMNRFPIRIYMDEHVAGDIHYHVATERGQKRIFTRLKAKLPALLPEGFQVHYYQDNENDIGVLDERDRQHMHIYYAQRCFSHNLHISFLQDSFKPIFNDILQRCFPKAEIEWIEMGRLG